MPDNNTNESVYLTEAELAERWRVTQRTILNYRKSGDTPPFTKLNGKVLYKRDEVEAFEHERTQKPVKRD